MKLILALMSSSFAGLSQKPIESFNGLALTPPMGFMTWSRFRCQTDCETYPDDCISEKLIKEVTDAMEQNGWKDAGYEYVIIDDCWPMYDRNETGYLVEDPDRFPSGMAALSKYVQDKGFKFGIYGDYGTLTCAGYPGTAGYEREDIDLFTEWGVEYYKVDGCYTDNQQDHIDGYTLVSDLVKEKVEEGEKGITLSCSYPVYWEKNAHNLEVDYKWLAEHCNLWRNFYDIEDDWNSVKYIMSYFANTQMYIAPYAGPGHWNDPDMLVGGNKSVFKKKNKKNWRSWASIPVPPAC